MPILGTTSARLFFTALLATFGPAVAAPQEAFQEWLRGAAEAEELRIMDWGSVDRDQDGQPDYLMATLCDPRTDTSGTSPWRVYEADGQRWVVEQYGNRCWSTLSGPPAFEPFEPEVVELPEGANYHLGVFIEPIDGRIVVTRTENQELSGFYRHHRVNDWLRGTTHLSWNEFVEDGDGGI